jgi:predicted NAD-dependent protein-ADP-ribosyltransferase YbiA (DUF1768 family)
MRTIIKAGSLILVPETGTESRELTEWKGQMTGHVLLVAPNAGTGVSLRDLGRQEDACHEPINVTSRSTDPGIRLLSNFAPTPFTLDGRRYRSVESFWQGLKFEDEAQRRRVACLEGPEARRAGEEKDYGATITYEGRVIPVGTRAHWDLMERACWAKFTQDEGARTALRATGERPLTHRVRRDSRTIPGVIMAEIWMKVRHQLREADAIRSNPISET